jgi:hypothetical protein
LSGSGFWQKNPSDSVCFLRLVFPDTRKNPLNSPKESDDFYKVKNFYKNTAFLILALTLCLDARAVDILTSAEHTFFDPKDTKRAGIEVEFMNISLEDSAKAVQKSLGGTLHKSSYTQLTTIKGYDSAGKPLYNTMEIPFYELKGSAAGNIVMKLESNQVSDTEMAKSKDVVIELVTEPIGGKEPTLPVVEKLQGAIDELAKAGAIGTQGKNAISTQINVEIGGGDKAKIKVMDTVNLMRSYFRPEHRKQINDRVPVPKVRQEYVDVYSPGFMKKLLDPNYAPKDWQELFDDYIYRQSLEKMGVRGAWTMPIKDAKKKLLAMKNPIEPHVVKQNALRATSLMAYMVPDDPMTKIMIDSGWIKPYPIVEFREFNNMMDVVGPLKQTFGLVSAAEQYGYYDHDRLMEELSGVRAEEIKQLRERSLKAEKKNKPYSWRYFLADPEAVDVDEYMEHKNNFYAKKDLVGFLSPSERGKKPLFVPGESVIMHRRPIHADNIVGKYNPGLNNRFIAQALENKYVEAKFFEEFTPGVMPKTKLLGDIVGKSATAEEVAKRLNQEFPKGWILKGVWDLGTEGALITDKMDVAAELKKYRESDFDDFKKALDSDPELKRAGIEYYQKELSSHPGYQGWRVSQALEKGKLTIVQDRMDIAKEFRVEVIGGKVLGDGSTIDRYAYKVGYNAKKSNVTKADIERVEKYVQKEIVDKLPAHLRGTPFAFDIALKKDGSYGMVESNPGSNSNFLYEEDWKPSVKALTEALDEYPDRVKKGKVQPGLSEKEQLTFLKDKFGSWGVSIKEQYPGFKFNDDSIVDAEFPVKEVDKAEFAVRKGKDACVNFYGKLYSVNKK